MLFHAGVAGNCQEAVGGLVGLHTLLVSLAKKFGFF